MQTKIQGKNLPKRLNQLISKVWERTDNPHKMAQKAVLNFMEEPSLIDTFMNSIPRIQPIITQTPTKMAQREVIRIKIGKRNFETPIL